MKKIAFFDIDGTMVNVPNGMLHPSEETKRVLKSFQNQGNYIIVATARAQVPDSVRDIDFDGYICSDGHYIEFQNEVLINNIFSDEEIEMQMKIYKEHNGYCLLGGYNGNWTNSYTDPYLKKHNEIYTGTNDLTGIPLVSDNTGKIQANSVTAVFGNAKDLFEAKDKLPKNWAINAYGDKTENSIRMDVHLEGFSKGTACEYLYKYLNIDKLDTYAYGDGSNDIEMLQLVGHGVAMGNASEKVKESANYVTDTVDNEGIAKAFKKYLNI